MDLADLLSTELVDHVLGHELSHLPDTGESLDQDRINRSLVLETL